MNSNNERLRRFLLLMQPTFLQGVATPPIAMPPKMLDNISSAVDFNTAAMPAPKPSTRKQIPARDLPVHDWGTFGEYEYLGPGTPYTAKREAGIVGRNELDEIARMHDSQYKWTAEHTIPGTGIITSGARGIADYGAGSAMIVASLNPWSGLSFKERLLGLAAGTGLQAQGAFRLTPAGWVVMPLVDEYVYDRG